MNKRLPSRGPRIMHGLGKLMRQARALGPAQAPIGNPTPHLQLAADHAEAMRDLGTLLARCKTAEAKVEQVRRVTESFELKLQQLPEAHEFRKLTQQVLDTYKRAIQ